MISGPFAQILETNRTRFNSKFIEARHYKPRLSAEAFSHHLLTSVAPIVNAVHACAPEKAADTAMALYDLSLDLAGQELLGPESRCPPVMEGWSQLLPRIPDLVAEAPRRVASAMTNALYNLSITPGARPHEWLETMAALAEAYAEVETFLKAGQVAAWRAGLAHYRTEALELCALLTPPIARRALGLPNAANLSTALHQLLDNPWLRPDSITQSPITNRQLQAVARVGAFRGFGGLFMAPPLVMVEDGRLVVWEGDNFWWLMADACGATLTRCAEPTLKAESSSAFQIDAHGAVTHSQLSRTFPELARATSSAALPHTLAVTTALSHAVTLIAAAEVEER